jgi:hypothetical protein
MGRVSLRCEPKGYNASAPVLQHDVVQPRALNREADLCNSADEGGPAAARVVQWEKDMFDPLYVGRTDTLQRPASARPLTVPPGHVGPFALPGTGRVVWWTGRVAIGLRHQREQRFGPLQQSALWIQALTLATRRPVKAASASGRPALR